LKGTVHNASVTVLKYMARHKTIIKIKQNEIAVVERHQRHKLKYEEQCTVKVGGTDMARVEVA
jgi:hypothetical protein